MNTLAPALYAPPWQVRPVAEAFDHEGASERGKRLAARRLAMRQTNGRPFAQLAFATEAGIAQGYLSELETGRKDLKRASTSTKERLARALGLDDDAFYAAFGVRVNPDAPVVPHSDYAIDRTGVAGGRMANIFPAGCGLGFVASEAIGQWPVGVRVPDEIDVIHLEARGLSMEPDLSPGDLATVALDDGDVRPGQMVGVYLPDSGVCIKWFVRDGEPLLLGSSNAPAHRSRVFEAPVGTRVMGRVVSITRRGTPTSPELSALDIPT